MRTDTKVVKDRIKKYLLENVTDVNENNFKTFEELAKYIKSELIRIFGNTHQSTFSDYLEGLPGGNSAADDMHYYHYYDYNAYLGNVLGETPEEYSKYTPEKAVELGTWLFYRELKKYF